MPYASRKSIPEIRTARKSAPSSPASARKTAPGGTQNLQATHDALVPPKKSRFADDFEDEPVASDAEGFPSKFADMMAENWADEGESRDGSIEIVGEMTWPDARIVAKQGSSPSSLEVPKVAGGSRAEKAGSHRDESEGVDEPFLVGETPVAEGGDGAMQDELDLPGLLGEVSMVDPEESLLTWFVSRVCCRADLIPAPSTSISA